MDATAYLSGNFAPVGEELTATDLEVIGSIPPELRGRYVRNGPNPIDPPDPARHHWFVGEGMVHGIRLEDGRASWYRNRWVRSPAVAERLGEAPPPRRVPEDRQLGSPNTNVVAIGGRTYAVVEAGSVPCELGPQLETVGPSDFGGTLPWGFTAHPHTDPVTGNTHAVAYWWGWGNKVQYLVLSPEGRVTTSVDITTPGDGSPMMHDMAITESRAVILDLPCIFDLDLATSGRSFPYRWHEPYGSRVGVLPLDGTGEVTWVDVEPCYVFHVLNAFDLDDGRLVVDVVRHPKVFDTDLAGPSEGAPTLDRWTIDPVAGKVIEERLDDRPMEFPRVDERRFGRPARYGYGVAIADGLEHGPLLRHDLRTGAVAAHDHGKGRSTMEAVFVPRDPDDPTGAEDDGWLMSVVHDAEENRAELVLLDASDFTGEPVARVVLPTRIPFGFHGNWLPDA
ncbi:MAG: carotenoid oxygenase family protein [Actinomycetota bacterium]|nr:carotenoid oxygenase family protein [Actinomycetota bacterium]